MLRYGEIVDDFVVELLNPAAKKSGTFIVENDTEPPIIHFCGTIRHWLENRPVEELSDDKLR